MPSLGAPLFSKTSLATAIAVTALWPARVKGQVGNGFDQLVLGQAIFARSGEVKSKLVGTVHRDQGADGHQAAIATPLIADSLDKSGKRIHIPIVAVD